MRSGLAKAWPARFRLIRFSTPTTGRRMETLKLSFSAAVVVSASLALALVAGCSSSTEAAGGADAAGGAGGTGEDHSNDVTVCGTAPMLPVSEDPVATGPWAVGVRTVVVDGLVTEIFYPAAKGSDAGKEKVVYDFRDNLPPEEGAKIPDENAPLQPCNCYRDLPLDEGHGPYPIVGFIHGTAGFRTQSLTHLVHWASRGFVVWSSDHPYLQVKDALGGNLFGARPGANTRAVYDALDKPSGELAFLDTHIDRARFGMAGHSAGGEEVGKLGDIARVLVPMSAGGAKEGDALESTLVLSGMDDEIIPFDGVEAGYEDTPAKKRLVGIANAGHMLPTDICTIGADQGGIYAIAKKFNLTIPEALDESFKKLSTDGCHEGQLSPEEGWAVVNAATTAVLEETLMCSEVATVAISGLQAKYSDIGEFQEAL